MKRKIPVSLIVILILVVIIALFVLYCSANRNSLALRLNCGINLPEPKKTEMIFTFDFMDGDEFEIWRYDTGFSPRGTMKPVTADNIYQAKSAFDNFRNDISYDDEQLRLYDQNFNSSQIQAGDYWARITVPKKFGSYLLLYYDVSHHLVYLMKIIS